MREGTRGSYRAEMWPWYGAPIAVRRDLDAGVARSVILGGDKCVVLYEEARGLTQDEEIEARMRAFRCINMIHGCLIEYSETF